MLNSRTRSACRGYGPQCQVPRVRCTTASGGSRKARTGLEVLGLREVDVGRRDDHVGLDVDGHQRLRVRVVAVEQLAERAAAIGEPDLAVVVPDEVGVPVVEQELEVGVVVLGALVGRDPAERRPRLRRHLEELQRARLDHDGPPRNGCSTLVERLVTSNSTGGDTMDVRSIEGAAPVVEHNGTVPVWWLVNPREMFDITKGGHLELVSEFEVAGGGFVDPHHHPTHEFYYVTSGRGIMTIGDETREIGQGDLVHIPPDAVHSLRPVSDHAPIHCFCFAVGVPDAGPVNYTEHWLLVALAAARRS